MRRLEGRVAIVSGAARGIGLAIAERLADEGAAVLLTDVREELVAEEAERLAGDGRRVAHAPLDVRSEDAWTAVVAEAERRLGPVDVLVNNAGAPAPPPLHELSLAAWEAALAVNLTGTFLGMRAVLGGMRERGRGAIVNVSSTTGPDVGLPIAAAYQAAKGGVTALTRHVAVTYGADGVRANAVHPGPVDTQFIVEGEVAEAAAAMAAGLPVARLGTPTDVAGAAAFLASDDAAWVTGTSLVVDGGFVVV